MLGKDLIKKIAENDAFDKEIVIDFTLKNINDETDRIGYVDVVEGYIHDSHSKIHIQCMED